MQKIAIPVFGNRVSSRLDCSESVLLATVEKGRVVRRLTVQWSNASVGEKFDLLLREGVAILICGGLTETCARLLHDSDIEVIPWVRGEAEEVLCHFVRGTLHVGEPANNNRRRS